MSIALGDRPLARLRDDLEISRGAPFLSGAPGWVIRDPVRHRFFQIGQRNLDILSQWSVGSVNQLKARLFAEKSINVSDEELEALTRFLIQSQLLEGGDQGTAARYARLTERSFWLEIWLRTQKLMFFRVPLVRPNGFLSATWPFVRPLFSRAFVWLSFGLLVVGLYLASRQLADIEAHIRQAFSWSGAAVFLGAIALVKVLHELGHAYQAIGRGLRVPVMGVALFAFLPLLYTDTTDAWRLRRRRDRVMVDLGGVLVELAVAIYATLLWCFLPDGAARTIFFAIATSSWVMSLVVNLNPFMRFDGYYLLSDSLGIQNLQQRAFALGRWALRRLLFGLDDPVPEQLDKSTRRGLIAYAYWVWIYRFFLFIAISLFVYSIFFKLAGIFLLSVAVAAFIVKPLLLEIRFWIEARDRIRVSRRSIATMSLALIFIAIFLWPISTRIYVPAVLEEIHQQTVFPPEAARLDAVFVAEGDIVARGDPLFEFFDLELPLRIEQSQTRIAMLNARLLSAAGDATERAEKTVTARSLEEETEYLSALQERQDSLLVLASTDGQVRELATDLDPGVWYSRTHLLGKIITSGWLSVRGLISEADLQRLDTSKGANFIADELSIPVLRVDGFDVSDFAVDRLHDGYLSRRNGGAIAVSPSESGEFLVAGVWYPVSGRLQIEGTPDWLEDDRVQRGVIVMSSKPQSYASRLGRRIAKVIIREIDF